MGIRVPEEVAIIGANNDDLVCGLSYPMLSSVSIPWDTIGGKVGEAMLSILAKDKDTPPNNSILIPSGGVILRHSANHLAVGDQTIRVTRAKQLLTQTNHPVSIISELSGFNDPERMAVVFKRVEGSTPSAYRKGLK